MSKDHQLVQQGIEYSEQLDTLVRMIVELRETESLEMINHMLADQVPAEDILNSCINAMQEIGRRFERGQYFIAALIMAGAIMSQTTELLEPHLKQDQPVHLKGTLLIGTVAGDIHDLGKDLFATLARFSGINVVDIGVDVQPERFVEETLQHKPNFIGISCVLTTAWPNLTETIALLHSRLPEPLPPIIIGGNGIDEKVCRHVKADFWAQDASEGVAICHRVLRQG